MDNRIFLLMGGGGSPQPTPSTHAVPLDFPIKIEFMGGSQVNITGPGTYTGTCDNGKINYSMVVGADKSCTLSYEIPGETQQPPVIVWGFTETPTSTGKFLKGKRYKFSFDKHILDGLYGGVAIFEIPVNITGGEQSTGYYNYSYYKEGLTEVEQCSDLSQLAEGGYCEINPDGELGEENMFGIYAFNSEYEPVTSGSFSFAFAFDENTDPILIQKSFNTNGIYSASDDDADGYSAVEVNVPQATFSPAATDTKIFAVPNAASVSYLISHLSSKTLSLNTFEGLFNNANLSTAQDSWPYVTLNNAQASGASAKDMFRVAVLGNQSNSFFPVISGMITNCNNMFYSMYGGNFPMTPMIYVGTATTDTPISFEGFCRNSQNITTAPKIRKHSNSVDKIFTRNTSYMFSGCRMLRVLYDVFDTSEVKTLQDNNNEAINNNMFENCFSMLYNPGWLASLLTLTKPSDVTRSFYYKAFSNCYVLSSLSFALPTVGALDTSYHVDQNMFVDTFKNCYRLKDVSFNSVSNVSWKNQVIDLTGVGYAASEAAILNYNSGITQAKKVTSQSEYQALKDDLLWYTLDINYSRYNHDSAVATINRLPNCSAYATGSEMNIIKFEGASGTNTDGGAISNLTAEEIAVATAKGWNVVIV